jgi:hypothetical protein
LKRGNLDKFESRFFDGILLGYTPHDRSYRVYNFETNTIIECAGDKKMDESIFIDEGLQGIDGDEDEPLLPSTSSPSMFLLPHLKQRLLRLPPLLQQQWMCHRLRGRSSLSRELPLTFRRYIHLSRS